MEITKPKLDDKPARLNQQQTLTGKDRSIIHSLRKINSGEDATHFFLLSSWVSVRGTTGAPAEIRKDRHSRKKGRARIHQSISRQNGDSNQHRLVCIFIQNQRGPCRVESDARSGNASPSFHAVLDRASAVTPCVRRESVLGPKTTRICRCGPGSMRIASAAV